MAHHACFTVDLAVGARTGQVGVRHRAVVLDELLALFGELADDLGAFGHSDEATVFAEVFGGWCPPWSSKPVRRATLVGRVRFPSASATL